MSKFAEKLVILKEAGEGVIQRLGYAKKLLSSPTQRPAFIGDAQFQKINAAFLKKFPEFESNLEKTPGYELLAAKAKPFYEELEPIYFTFVDAFEFKEAAVVVLGEIGSNTIEMRLDDNPILTSTFLDLFALYAQVNILISTIEERRLVVAVYYKLFQHIKCSNEQSYQRLANYLNNFVDPIKSMQDEFRSLSSSLGKTLVNLVATYSKLRTINLLRKEGAFNITLKPEEMAKPVIDKFHSFVVYSAQMHLWITFGFLLCPETLMLPGAIELCKQVLSESYVIPIWGNTTVQIHGDYDNLFSNYKSKTLNLNKQKKVIKDVLIEAASKGPMKHKERRTYLRQELNSLLLLLQDEPGLLGPKFQMLLGGLALAKEEVFWYFRHLKAPAPKGYTKKVTEDDLRDNRISELIYLVDKLITLVKQHKSIVQNYYVEYLRGAHSRKLGELCNHAFNSSVGTGISQITKSIMDDIKNADASQDFKALRLNWFRVEGSLSSIQSPTPLVKVKDVVDRLTLVAEHTRFVDEIDKLLDEYASLKALWHYKDAVSECLSRAIKDGPNQPLHCVSFMRLVAEFPGNVNMYNAEELPDVGAQSVAMAEKMMSEICLRITSLITEVAKSFTHFDDQLAPVNVAYVLLQTQKDYKPPKDFVPPVHPGTESEYRRRQEIDNLRLYERNVWQLCSALNEFSQVQVFDTVFAPKQYLKEKLHEALIKHIRANAVVEVTDDKHHVERIIQRPTILEGKINSFVSALKLVETLIDIDTSAMIRETLISESYISALGKTGSLDWVNLEETDVKYNGSLIGSYVQWYGDFVAKRLATPGIVFSPSRRSFVSRAGLAFKAELYADLVEFKSLVNLVGPYGVKLIDREVLKFILNNVNGIKDYVSHNRQMLDELSKIYANEGACNEALKKLKDADGFITKSIAIGNALSFRDLLHEALRLVVEEKTPYIFNAVHNSFKQYRRNTYMSTEFLTVDSLASDCGIRVGTADQALKKFFSKAIGSADAPLLDLLPLMFAAAFTSNGWREATYKSVIEGHVNNAHTLAKTINALIVAFKSINSNSTDEKEITSQLKTFVEVSSVILLRVARNTKQDKFVPVDFPSIITFMDMFISESPLLTRDVLESVLPYALLRNEWKIIFTPKVKEGKEGEYKW